MATYLQICKDVRAQAGIAGDGPSSVVSQTGIYLDVVRWVDEAYNEIQTMHENWNFLFASHSITLPDTFNSYPVISGENIRQVVKDSVTATPTAGGDITRVKYVPYAVWRLQDRYIDGRTGLPTHYTESPAGDAIFYPTPDEDYTITLDAYDRPDIMEENTDVPIFHSQYHDLIKLKALMKYGEYYNSMEVYQSAEANFRMVLKNLQFSELPKDNLITPAFVPFA